MSRDEADGLELNDCVAWANGGRFGGAKRDRTADLLRARQALSQLSYGPDIWWVWADSKKPGDLTLSFDTPRVRSLQLSVRWWVWADLNGRPHPYQGCALTN